MSSLHGARVALLESRMSAEIAAMVRRMGGTPVPVPAVRERPRTEEAAAFLDALVSGQLSTVIFQTGAGAAAIFNEAERRGRLDEAVARLREATVVCRGPKPTAVVRRYGIASPIVPVRPYTSRELLQALAGVDLASQQVGLVHYGERNVALADALRARGAWLTEACPYEWALPEDIEPMRALIVAGADHVEAIAFTSQIQVRNLFALATSLGLAQQLTASLTRDVIVASVGPVCSDALRAAGITPDVEPGDPKMGPLLIALADYIELTREE
jgi:uroporphyrinogen-III synthase